MISVLHLFKFSTLSMHYCETHLLQKEFWGENNNGNISVQLHFIISICSFVFMITQLVTPAACLPLVTLSSLCDVDVGNSFELN